MSTVTNHTCVEISPWNYPILDESSDILEHLKIVGRIEKREKIWIEKLRLL